jgi:hypothetical protein
MCDKQRPSLNADAENAEAETRNSTGVMMSLVNMTCRCQCRSFTLSRWMLVTDQERHTSLHMDLYLLECHYQCLPRRLMEVCTLPEADRWMLRLLGRARPKKRWMMGRTIPTLLQCESATPHRLLGEREKRLRTLRIKVLTRGESLGTRTSVGFGS